MDDSSERNARHLLNASIRKEQRLKEVVKLERKVNEELQEKVKKLESEILGLRRIAAEATGGLTVESFQKGDQQAVQVRPEMSEEVKYEISVNVLTEILKSEGVLEVVLAKIRESEEPPVYSMGKPVYKRRDVVAEGALSCGLANQLRDVSNLGLYQQRDADLRNRSLNLDRREKEVAAREELVNKRRDFQRKRERDSILDILKKRMDREEELWESIWMDNIEKEMEEEEEGKEQGEGENDDTSQRVSEAGSEASRSIFSNTNDEPLPAEPLTDEVQIFVAESDIMDDQAEDGEPPSDSGPPAKRAARVVEVTEEEGATIVPEVIVNSKKRPIHERLGPKGKE